MPSAWGHTRLLETDWRFITQESHRFSCGSVNDPFHLWSPAHSETGRIFPKPAPLLIFIEPPWDFRYYYSKSWIFLKLRE